LLGELVVADSMVRL